MMDEQKSRSRGPLAILAERVDCDLLVYFRIAFALVAFCWVAKQFTSGAIEHVYTAPRFHFHYFGFHWVQPLSPSWTYVEFLVAGIAALLIGLGACYRAAAFVFALAFTHLFLVEKCLYQNHYYLICLVSWLMVIVPANCALSVDAWWRPSTYRDTVPKWSIWLLRFQVGLPYFYGGIAKLNPDWLAGEPMRAMLAQRAHFPLVGPFFVQEWCVYLFTYGGLFFDLLVVPALLTKRFRLVACLAALGFNLTNSLLFTIGVFPWFMLLSLLIFFPIGSLRKQFARWKKVGEVSTSADRLSVSKPFAFVLAMFVLWQCLFPLRHFAIPGNPSWTEEGHYFAWHMLLRGKVSALRYTASDSATGKTGTVDLRPFVTEFQLSRLSRDPRMIHELAGYISDELRSLGFDGVELRALALVSMNGRKPQLMIDPSVDLASEQLDWRMPKWIVPLKEPLPDEPWNEPISRWEALLKHD